MAGVSVDSGGGGRKELNSEINMVPMIDLLMVTISFLLITAVWTHMSRLDADAQVPSDTAINPPCTDATGAPCPPKKKLHIDMKGEDKFVLSWREGGTVIRTAEVARHDVVSQEGAVRVVRFPELARTLESEWKAAGSHTDPTDRQRDEAVLHTDNATSYAYIIAAIDAVYQVHRAVKTTNGKVDAVPAFNVTFAAAN